MRMILVVLAALSITAGVSAQALLPVHELPFASNNNMIELAIENDAPVGITAINVRAEHLPRWLTFKSENLALGGFGAGEKKTARFVFAVDKQAPVEEKQTIIVVVTGTDNQRWTREIIVAVAPPLEVGLFQNFPNPFNPVTHIGYVLPADSYVRLSIYNLIGQEVAALVDGEQEAGYHQVTWNASSFSSGPYISRLTARERDGREVLMHKGMILMK